MTRNRAVAALSGIAVLALAACGTAPASQPFAKTAATQTAQPRPSGPAGPASTSNVSANMVPTGTAATKKVPARERSETIPAGATTVTLVLKPDANTHASPPKPDKVTDPAKIRQLTALINRLPAFPAGVYSCPFDGGAQLVLTFGVGQGRPALAVATVKLEGCEGTDLTISGVSWPALGPLDGGRQTAAQALKIAGLNHWSLNVKLPS
jgi:lipoprotein-anchoring transpeptidase ErfK/SrfK